MVGKATEVMGMIVYLCFGIPIGLVLLFLLVAYFLELEYGKL